MNERIDELAEQASQYASRETTDLDEWEFIFRKKFAALIVAECADIALEQKKWVEDQVVFDPRDQAWNKARIQQSQRIADKIQEHFGVEQ